MKNPGRWVVFSAGVVFVLLGIILGALGSQGGYAETSIGIGAVVLFFLGFYVMMESD